MVYTVRSFSYYHAKSYYPPNLELNPSPLPCSPQYLASFYLYTNKEVYLVKTQISILINTTPAVDRDKPWMSEFGINSCS